ncbi:MAG TPA: OsmC family protein [Vicinamibacterales bacterium]|nr:OsmC family protein [Vicinamibacterales bacterium]
MSTPGEPRHAWSVRISANEPGVSRAFVRRHRFLVGDPVQFDAAYPHVTALEYALVALGAELAGGLRALARTRRVAIEELEALVTGELNNPLICLGVLGETGHPGLERVRVKLYVRAPDPEAVRALWDTLLARSPLTCTLRAAVRLELELAVER